MKRMLLVLAAGAAVLSAAAEESRIIRAEGYDAPAAWQIMPVRGEEMRFGCFGGPSDIKALEAMPDLAMFRNIWIGLPGPLGVAEFTSGPETNCIRKVAGTPAEAKQWTGARPIKFTELLKTKDWAPRWEWSRKFMAEHPSSMLTIAFWGVRPAAYLKDVTDTDHADFAKWREENPGFFVFGAYDEYDSDVGGLKWKRKYILDPEVKARIHAQYPSLDDDCENHRLWTDRDHEKLVSAHFGSDDFCGLWSVEMKTGHRMARKGIRYLRYEAEHGSTAAPYAWGGMHARGASRQFRTPFGWYGAVFTNNSRMRDGTNPDGKDGTEIWRHGFTQWPNPNNPEPRLHLGASRSLINRNMTYGAMIGSTSLSLEGGNGFLWATAADGKGWALSPYGEDYERLFKFVYENERGKSFTPVALLTSLDDEANRQFYSKNNRDKFAQAAVLETLVPTPVSAAESLTCTDMRNGGEGCMFNSEFGEMCDVLCPDAGQDPVKFSQALFAYKAAVLVGAFSPKHFDRQSVRDYVTFGGTLFCSCDQVTDGFVAPELAGVRFGSGTVKGAGELGEGYSFRTAVPTTAKPLWTDANGTVVAWVNDSGRGRVVTVTARRMLPDELQDEAGWWPKKIQRIVTTELRFPIIRKVLRTLRDELMPVTVEGDIQWGVNRTREGWLLWLINNKGVRKFAFEPEELDPKATAHVKVTLKTTGRVYEADVGPGGTAFVRMPVGPDRVPAGFALGYQMDVSRDKIPQAGRILGIVDLLGKLGYNQFQIYFKNAFAYAAHPEMQKGVSPLTPEDIRTIDAACAQRGIDLVPYQNVFGHLEPWMRHPKYRHLAEIPFEKGRLRKRDIAAFARIPESWTGDNDDYQPGALCATAPESLDFAKGLLDELLPCFRSAYVNTGCDEVWDLASYQARSREKVLKVGAARTYLDHLLQIDRLVRAHGRKMMYWGDIILHSPELVPELPEDGICLNWGYDADSPYDRTCPLFRKAGRKYYNCPSTAAYCNFFGNVGTMKANVDNALANGLAYGASGLLLTDWGDYGNPQPWITSVPGLVYTAARAKGEHLPDAELSRRIDALLGCTCGEALVRYGRAGRIAGCSLPFDLVQGGADWKRPKHLRNGDVENMIAELKAAGKCFRPEGAPAWVASDFRTLDLLTRIFEAAWRGELAAKRPSLEAEYRRLWIENNRPGGVDDSVRQVLYAETHN